MGVNGTGGKGAGKGGFLLKLVKMFGRVIGKMYICGKTLKTGII